MNPISSVWRRLPVILRAIIAGALISLVGYLPRNFLILANFKVSPTVPWAVLVMSLYLWVFWLYLGGSGWPQTTSEARRNNLRGGIPTQRIWWWSLFAGGLASVALRAILDVVRRLSTRPSQDLIAPEQLNKYPFHTVLLFMLMTAAIAGIVEEVAFRGYMQKPIEKRYGGTRAILIVAIVFCLAHYRFGVRDPWPWLIFTPAYFAVGVALGLLAHIADSIVPGVICHAAIDAAAFLRYWWLGIPKSVWVAGFDTWFWLECVIIVVFGIAATRAFSQLALVARFAKSHDSSEIIPTPR
jgi:membrane protease YdiL (CAAX protease family)